MKKLLFPILLVAIQLGQANAQNCNNLDFENGDFSNWSGATGTVSTGPIYNWTNLNNINSASPNVPPSSTAQHTLLNVNGLDPNCYDPTTGQPAQCMTLIAPGGGGWTVRLGNSNINNETERLRYTISVTAANPSFSYSYAVVLEDPSHSASEQPRFDVRTYDQNGVPIPGSCGSYSVYAGSDPSFITNPGSAPNPFIKYKCWTTVGVDLSPYIGQNITVEFQTADCTLGGHFGYAYIDLSCAQLQASATFCPGDTNQMLIAPAGFVSYQWYDPLGNPIVGGTNDSLIISNGNIGDQYQVVMNSLSGCQATMVTTLAYSSISTFPTITPACYAGTTGTASIAATGGTYPYQYIWSDGQTTQTASNLASGTYTVTTNSGGCTRTDTLIVPQQAPPAPSIGIVPYCLGDPAGAFFSTNPGLSHQWYDPTGTAISGSAGNNDTLFISNPVGGQVYTDTMTNASGCITIFQGVLDTTQIVVTVSNIVNNCFGTNQPAGSATVNVTGGVNPYIYQWSNSQTTSTATNLANGTYTVIVTSGSCVDTTTAVVTAAPAPPPTNSVVNFCPGGPTFALPPSNFSSHQWYSSTGGSLSSNDTLFITNPVNGQQFVDSMRNANGCLFAHIVTLNDTNITTNVNVTNNPCFLDSVGTAFVSASGSSTPYTYLWSTGATTQNINNLPAGMYTVTVTSGACIKIDTAIVSAPPPPPDTMDVAYDFCPDDPFITIHAPSVGSGYTYEWYALNSPAVIGTGDSLVIANPAIGSGYVVMIQPPSGCAIIDTITLNYTPPNLPDYMLKNNVFTPNGDGKNDRFEVFFPYTKTFHIEVYNRWGKKIYESDNFNIGEGWDGKIKGVDADEGVYYWMATYTSRCVVDETEYQSRGFVHLIRSQK
jgi:gliding motility-associated-like protein